MGTERCQVQMICLNSLHLEGAEAVTTCHFCQRLACGHCCVTRRIENSGEPVPVCFHCFQAGRHEDHAYPERRGVIRQLGQPPEGSRNTRARASPQSPVEDVPDLATEGIEIPSPVIDPTIEDPILALVAAFEADGAFAERSEEESPCEASKRIA